MRDPYELIEIKEEQIQRVKKEIEALRITARLLREDDPDGPEGLHQVIPMP